MPGMATIGRYEIAGTIAIGQRGELRIGRDPAGRPVAIKRLPAAAGRGTAARHGNLVEVYELVQQGDDLFAIEEYLEGENLGGLVRRLVKRRETLPLALVAHVMAEVCSGLHAAHQAGELHRAVAPDHVFVTYRGAVKLLDLGISSARTDSPYRSPEQAGQRPLGRESDVYSAGLVLYELATLRRPIGAGASAASGGTIPPPTSQVAAFPACLDLVCRRATEREPSRRYRTAADMRDALYEAARELGVDTEPNRALAQALVPLFRDRIAQKRELLDRVRVGLPLGDVMQGEVDEDVAVPVAAGGRRSTQMGAVVPPTPPPRGIEIVVGGDRAPTPMVGSRVEGTPMPGTRAELPPERGSAAQLSARSSAEMAARTSAQISAQLSAQLPAQHSAQMSAQLTAVAAPAHGTRWGVIALLVLSSLVGGSIGYYLRVYG